MRIKEIVTRDIKGRSQVIELDGQHLLLVGPSGSGKTAVTNGVTLAVAGCVTELGGRFGAPVREVAALRTLGNAPYARVTYVDDHREEWSLTGKTPTWTSDREAAEGRLPAATAAEMINSVKSASVAARLARVTRFEANPSIAKAAAPEAWDRLAPHVRPLTAANVRAVIEAREGQLRALRKEYDGISVVYAEEVTPEVVEDLEDRIADLTADGPTPEALAWADWHQRNAAVRASIAAAREALPRVPDAGEFAALDVEHDAATVELEAATAAHEEIRARLAKSRTTLAAHDAAVDEAADVRIDACVQFAVANEGVCAFCDKDLSEEIEALATLVEQRHATTERDAANRRVLCAQIEKQEAEETAAARRVMRAEAVRANLITRAEALVAQHDRATAAAEKLEASAKKRIAAIEAEQPDCEEPAERATHNGLLGLLQAKLADTKRRADAFAAYQTAVGQRAGVQEQINAASADLDALRKVLDAVLVDQVALIAQAATAFIPENLGRAHIEQADGELSVGWVPHGKKDAVTAMSGGQWSMFVIAVGAILASDPYAVLMPPVDRGIDRANLFRWMETLREVGHTVVLTTTEGQIGAVPVGWKIVHL